MAEERAAAFGKRSIETFAKLAGLKLAISMMDLTTLEGKDMPGKIAFVCRKAIHRWTPVMTSPPARRFAFIRISFGSRKSSSETPASKSLRSPQRFRPD